NDYGVWGWTWSYTTYCAGSFNYTPNQLALQRGATYTFTMSISAGNVTFLVAQGSHAVATIVGKSGGTQFTMQSFFTCSSGATYYDYTDYEEIYTTVQSMPSFNFFFTKNVVSSGNVSNWTVFGSPPSGVTTALSHNAVRVENEGFSLGFLSARDRATLAPGTTAFATNISILRWAVVGNVSLTASGLPKGMALTFGNAKAGPPFSTNLTITLTTVVPGTYDLSLVATDSSARYTYITLELKVR
ncbi:MAG: hypothetical protein L3J96_00365, partial [Thermoplasmata archaeon]|nr:hypothetical protein [Thermoplasmata archaeon]